MLPLLHEWNASDLNNSSEYAAEAKEQNEKNSIINRVVQREFELEIKEAFESIKTVENTIETENNETHNSNFGNDPEKIEPTTDSTQQKATEEFKINFCEAVCKLIEIFKEGVKSVESKLIKLGKVISAYLGKVYY